MPNPFLEYGVGGWTDQPLRQRKLSIEDLLAQRTGMEPTPTAMPATVPPGPVTESDITSAVGEVPGMLDLAQPTAQPGWFDRMGQGVAAMAPVLARMGQALTADPRNPYFSNLIGVTASAMESQKLNEALKKMIQEQLGEQGPPRGPDAKPRIGLGGLDVLGLSPEQVAGVYKTGMEVREQERQFPVAATKAYSDAYQSIAAGDLSSANAAAKRLEMEMAAMPENAKIRHLSGLVDIYKKIADMEHTQATTRKIGAEATGLEQQAALSRKYGDREARAKISEIEARTDEIDEKIRMSIWGRSEEGLRQQAHYKALERRQGYGFKKIPLGDEILIFDPVEERVVARWPVGVSPDVAAKEQAQDVERLLKVYNPAAATLAGEFLQQAEKDLISRLGADQGAYEMARLRQMFGQSVLSGQANPWIVYGSLSDASKEKFREKFDRLRAVLAAGGGLQVGIISDAPAAPTPPEPGAQPAKPRRTARKVEAETPVEPPPFRLGEPLSPEVVSRRLAEERPGQYRVNGVLYNWDGRTATRVK